MEIDLNKFDEALDLCDKLPTSPNRSLSAQVDHLRGRVLHEINRFDDALESLDRALHIFRDDEMPDCEADILSFISDVYLAKGDKGAAWEAAMLAYDTYQRFPDHIGCAEAAWTLGNISSERERRNEAADWYRKSFHHAERSADPSTLLEATISLAELLVGDGVTDEALRHLLRAQQIARQLREKAHLQRINLLIAKAQTASAKPV